jgi:hypothetical protein
LSRAQLAPRAYLIALFLYLIDLHPQLPLTQPVQHGRISY